MNVITKKLYARLRVCGRIIIFWFSKVKAISGTSIAFCCKSNGTVDSRANQKEKANERFCSIGIIFNPQRPHNLDGA